MIKGFPGPMAKLIEEFGKMPGIGPRSAQRWQFPMMATSPSPARCAW